MVIASALFQSGVFDLRQRDVESALVRVEGALGTWLDRVGLVRKRRSVGARTGRGTWARIEARRLEKIGGQGWNGLVLMVTEARDQSIRAERIRMAIEALRAAT